MKALQSSTDLLLLLTDLFFLLWPVFCSWPPSCLYPNDGRMGSPRAGRPNAPSVSVPAPTPVRRSQRVVRPRKPLVSVDGPAPVRRTHRAVRMLAPSVSTVPVVPVSDRPLISWYRKRKSRSSLLS